MVQSTGSSKFKWLNATDVTHEKEVMVLWFRAQVLEDSLLPITLHMIPVINHSMPNRIMYTVSRGFRVCKSFIANEEVKIFYPPFGSKVTWFSRNSGGPGVL